MKKSTRIVTVAALVLAGSVMTLVACSDSSSSSSSSGNPFNPPSPDSGPSSSGGNPEGGPTTDGGCPNKPAGCFCGTPTTQAQFLNRCTNATALPVNLTVKPATTADIP